MNLSYANDATIYVHTFKNQACRDFSSCQAWSGRCEKENWLVILSTSKNNFVTIHHRAGPKFTQVKMNVCTFKENPCPEYLLGINITPKLMRNPQMGLENWYAPFTAPEYTRDHLSCSICKGLDETETRLLVSCMCSSFSGLDKVPKQAPCSVDDYWFYFE